jgi:ferredoxin
MSDPRASEIRKIAQGLFAEGKIELFLGFEQGSLPLHSRPCFVRAGGDGQQAAGVERLIWDSFCANNLAAYLPKYYENLPNRAKKRDKPYPRIGIAAKACDLRSIVALTKEKQVRLESLVVVGVPCRGMIDARKVEAASGGKEILGHEEVDGDTLQVAVRGAQSLSLPREQVLQDCCLECRHPVPEGAEVLVSGQARKPGDGGYARVKEFEAKSQAERWEHFRSELSRCIRCNACRQACPMCYCQTCLFDQNRPKWIGADLSDVAIYHLVRALHLAGRCTECGACERACPMGIDVRLLARKLSAEVEDLYGYRPGESAEATPVLSSFAMDDPQDFVTEP